MFKREELWCFTYFPFLASNHCINHRIVNSQPFLMITFALHSNSKCEQNACLNVKNGSVSMYVLFWASNHCIYHIIVNSQPFLIIIFALHLNVKCEHNACLNVKSGLVSTYVLFWLYQQENMNTCEHPYGICTLYFHN